MKVADKFIEPMENNRETGYEFLDEVKDGKGKFLGWHLGWDLNWGKTGWDDLGKQVNPSANAKTLFSNKVKSRSKYNLGECMILLHELPDGTKLCSRYGHLNKRWVAEGQDVEIGQGMAECGNTGTDYPHLHFEIFTYEFYEKFIKQYGANFYPWNWDRGKILTYFLNPRKFIEENREIKVEEEPEVELAVLKEKSKKYDELLKRLSQTLKTGPNEGAIESEIKGLLTKEDIIPEIKKETKVAVTKPQELIDSLCNLIQCPEKTEKSLRERLLVLRKLELRKKDLKVKEETVKQKIERLKKIKEGGKKSWTVKVIQGLRKFFGGLSEYLSSRF